MIWEKLGKIFDPKDFELFGDCKEFAQSPQTIVLDDRIRVYFSTRPKDDQGMFLSKIAYVDFERDFSNIIGVSKHEVLPLGNLGTFDEHGIFPISPFQNEGKLVAYTCGWSRRVSVPVETSTGLVISNDGGRTFQRTADGSIFSSSLKQPMLVGDSFVRKYGSTYYMWYIFGQRWKGATDIEPQARVYKIAQATSLNGIDWQRFEENAILPDVLNEDECQALPTVIKINDTYHMYFCYREATDFRKNPNRSYRLGYAYSNDLVNWTRDERNVGIFKSNEGWDAEMMCYPHLLEVDKSVYMLYNGNKFGKHGFGLAKLKFDC